MNDHERTLKDMEYRIQDCIEEALGIATAYQFQKRQTDPTNDITTIVQWGMEVGTDDDQSQINKYLEDLVMEIYNRLMEESDKLHLSITNKETKQ